MAMQRFTIDIDEKFSKTLEDLAQGGTKADVVRRAVATYKYLKDETSKDGNAISISNNGVITKDLILPS